MSGLSEHVIYEIPTKLSILAKESAMVQIASFPLKGSKVLLYDPKTNELNASKALHLLNTSEVVLANGTISVIEGGRFVSQTEFTPMLPNDDQLLIYGVDSTVSSYCKKLESTEVTSVSILYQMVDGHLKDPKGCTISHKVTKQTTYNIKNNSTKKSIPRFYIDHTADTRHDGFVVVTKERCMKSVMGFSRYEFVEIPVLGEVSFKVEETATFKQEISNTAELIQFVSRRAPALLEQNVMHKETLAELKSIISRSQTLSALKLIESSNYTEKELNTWKGLFTVDPDRGTILPKELIELIEKVILLQNRTKDIDRTIATHNEHINKVFQNQTRLRENIRSLEKLTQSELIKRYLKDLDKEEDDLQKTRSKIEELEQEKSKVESELKELRLRTSSDASKIRDIFESQKFYFLIIKF
jgi:vacuolar-type H+-ATPase subunit I/STV1